MSLAFLRARRLRRKERQLAAAREFLAHLEKTAEERIREQRMYVAQLERELGQDPDTAEALMCEASRALKASLFNHC